MKSINIDFKVSLGHNIKIKYKFKKEVNNQELSSFGDGLFDFVKQLTISLIINSITLNPIGLNLMLGLLILFPR